MSVLHSSREKITQFSPPIDQDPHLVDQFHAVRQFTEILAEPLTAEDQTVQSMPDASPTKWHRAHTTWFYETFILLPLSERYTEYDPDFSFLFNSYYEAVGPRAARHQRGLLTRPGVGEVTDYRRAIDNAMDEFLTRPLTEEVADLLILGLNHEQQHQELLLMDILHAFSLNPLRPAYAKDFHADKMSPSAAINPAPKPWHEFSGGLVEIGHCGNGFHYDNEGPRHKTWLEPYRIAGSLITNADWLHFMAEGGYQRSELWLSDGWTAVQSGGWTSPLYWEQGPGGEWKHFGLQGLIPLALEDPVCHVSHYEADAFARWAQKRLPTESEWEHAAQAISRDTDLRDSFRLSPSATSDGQWIGQVWQWTSSPYIGYRGYCPPQGAVGEYNGKFMSNQMTLRGGACVTPLRHSRVTYRNFYSPASRWAMTGLRLAEDG